MPHLLMVGVVLAVAACSDSTGPGNGDGDGPPSATESVDVEDNEFVAPAVRVLVGGTVTWTWRGNNLHNVTFPGVPASATQTAGTYERTFATAGSFPYLCTIHGEAMSGTVTVVAAEPPGQ
jgi:plastocyanin